MCTHTHTKFVNQNFAALWDVFNCSYDDGDNRIHGIWTNLKVKAGLSSVVILQLCVFFFWLSVGNNSLKFSSFKIPILKYLKKFCLLSFRCWKCEVLLPLLLLKTQYESSIFVLLIFFLEKGKAHMQLSHSPHNYPCWWLSRVVAAEF